jgi:hypothetical protein
MIGAPLCSPNAWRAAGSGCRGMLKETSAADAWLTQATLSAAPQNSVAHR